jgi:hypothetical protein
MPDQIVWQCPKCNRVDRASNHICRFDKRSVTVQIDKGIPLPPRLAGGHPNSKYPFRAMQPGDSVPCDGDLTRAANLVTYWHRALGDGVKFGYCRMEDGTVRIWRVK